MKKPFILAAALALLAMPALANHIECITEETKVTTSGVDLSATALVATAKELSYNVEVFTDTDLEGAGGTAPATCTDEDSNSVTCNGWDTSASAEVYMRCDDGAPWLKMPGTGTYTAAAIIGPVRLSRCQIRLRVVSSGATSSACFYLGLTGGQLDSDEEVQDESDRGSWAVVP